MEIKQSIKKLVINPLLMFVKLWDYRLFFFRLDRDPLAHPAYITYSESFCLETSGEALFLLRQYPGKDGFSARHEKRMESPEI